MKKKICLVVSSSMTFHAFLREPIRRLCECYDVYVALNINPDESLPNLEGLVTFLSVDIERKISPWRDFLALWQMIRLFRRYRFNLVHSVTPKAGLLAMAAAFLTGINTRIHTFTGQVWATRSGVGRWAFKNLDRLIGFLATHILVDSLSQQQFLINEKVVTSAKSAVLAQGSISGVDISRFIPNPAARERIRTDLGIPMDHTIFLFLGRLNRDKGVLDLAAAFAGMDDVQSHLLMVGPDEEDIRAQMAPLTVKSSKRIHFIDFTTRPEDYMAAADVLCLPSYREGFGNVVIEAAACGIPAIGSRIYGVMDAIDENHTGLLFEARNVTALGVCLSALARDKELRLNLGRQARKRVLTQFSSERLASAWLEFYKTRC